MLALLARAGHVLVLAAYIARELATDAAALVIALVNPRHRFRPRLIEVPLRCRTERGIALFGLLITLSSPRQVTVAVQTEPPMATIYMLDAKDAETPQRDVARLENLFLRAAGDPVRPENSPEVPR